MFFHSLDQILAGIPAILIAITFHEYAHGKTAALLGDPTPEMQGRLSLNPFKHLDPLGAIMLLVVGFGWAKPVQINPYYFRNDRKKGVLYVALAGPVMNLVLAYLSAVALRLVHAGIIGMFFFYLLWYNAMLAVFNLIPLPPLDGSKILAGLLPSQYLSNYYKFESYGPIILILLLVTDVIDIIMQPVVQAVLHFIQLAAGWGIF
mgnify:CR=1 FL=1